MYNLKYITLGLTTLLLTGCSQKSKISEEKNIDYEMQNIITDFSESIFDKEIINSMEILDYLLVISDTIFEDTAKYYRTPKATIYANNSADTYFQIFENPKDTITVISFYKNKIRINTAEYYDNGQIMCKFKVTKKGIRDGHYYCFYEDGTYRAIGFYKNGEEITDSNKRYYNNDWQKDGCGCLHLRTLKLADFLIVTNNLLGKSTKEFMKIFGPPNRRENEYEQQQTFIYYLNSVCKEGIKIEGADECWVEFIFKNDELMEIPITCHIE